LRSGPFNSVLPPITTLPVAPVFAADASLRPKVPAVQCVARSVIAGARLGTTPLRGKDKMLWFG
jgi:hypothetical protein